MGLLLSVQFPRFEIDVRLAQSFRKLTMRTERTEPLVIVENALMALCQSQIVFRHLVDVRVRVLCLRDALMQGCV